MGAPDSSILVLEDWTSPGWRLNTLYTCVDKSGVRVPFRMNPEQRRLWSNLWYWNLVLKCRQAGFSTFIDLVLLDFALFNRDVRGAVIAQTQDDAISIFDRKIKQPYDHLPRALREKCPLISSSKTDMVVAHEGAKSSHVYVDISARSDTLNFLHISEFGKICATRPDTAKEIVTGSFPAIHRKQFVFVESTAEGDEGYFADYAVDAFQRQEQGIKPSERDFRAHFFAWWEVEGNRINPDGVLIEEGYRRYFSKLAAERGIVLDPHQQAWYVTEARHLGKDMKRENPSYWREAFEASRDGIVFETEMQFLRQNNRITKVPYEPRVPVNTFWDIGISGATAIWFHQRVGLENRLIRYMEDVAEGVDFYAREIQKHNYVLGTHFLPHDADMRRFAEQGLTTVRKLLEPILPGKYETVPKIPTKQAGIEVTRPFLLTCWIDQEMCADGIKCLDQYKYEWDERLGKFKNYPAETWAAHGTDALRQGAQGFGRTVKTGAVQPVKRVRRNWRS